MNCKYFQLFPITEDGCRHPKRDRFPEAPAVPTNLKSH